MHILQHQKEVVTNRTKYDLNKAKDRQHIVEGSDEGPVDLGSSDCNHPGIQRINGMQKITLISKFEFTEAQSEAIVSFQLYRLTNTDITALQAEAEELVKADRRIRRYWKVKANLQV